MAVPRSLPLHVLRDRGDLSPMEAIVHHLVDEAGHDADEVARAIGSPAAQVRFHLSRARRKLPPS